MFSLRAKQRPIPSIYASDSSIIQLYICFRSFRPDFLSVFHGEDTVPPHELRIDRKSQCQTAADAGIQEMSLDEINEEIRLAREAK